MLREAITASPLYWPMDRPRTRFPDRANFRPTTVHQETQYVLAELARMGVASSLVVVSTNLRLRKDGLPTSNQAQPLDCGVAVWFEFTGKEYVLACDAWDRIEHNLRAIGKHIEALRGQERWGVGSMEQAFRGFVALPEQASRSWREVLGFRVDERVTRDDVERARKARALDAHPDMPTGSLQRWHELSRAVDQARKEIQ